MEIVEDLVRGEVEDVITPVKAEEAVFTMVIPRCQC